MKTTISVRDLDDFTARLERLNRKAAKFGWDPIVAVIGEAVYYQVDERMFCRHEVSISWEPMVLAGNWRLVGVIDHREGIVRPVPNEYVPDKYFGAPDWCDHCKSVRNRTETFIVRSESEDDFKQVGRDCLSDFLGIDAETALAQADISDMLTVLCDEDEGDTMRVGYVGVGLENFLSVVSMMQRLYGWRSRAQAQDGGGPATADMAMSWFAAPAYNRHDSPVQAEIDTAKAVVEWMRRIVNAEKSDYLYNLRQIAENGFVTDKTAGYAASAPRAMFREMEKAEAAAHRQYVGKIGEKITVTARLVASPTYSGTYGTTWKHRFQDENGNVFIWSTNGHLDPGVGAEYRLTAKVKDHRDDGYGKTTYITHARCEAL